MNFILKHWVKYYTKEAFKTLKLVTIGSVIIITVACVKYKPAYKVTLAGKTIGFITDRELVETKINNYINDTTNNIAFREIDNENLPKYEFELVNRSADDASKEILACIEDLTTTTYRFYAVTQDGEAKTVVRTQEEANNVINQIKADLNSEIELNLGIVDLYTTEYKFSSEEEATNTLNEIKVAKVSEYETKKAAEKAAAEEAARKARYSSYSRASSSTTSSGSTGSISGLALVMPVSGSISSRYGERSSSRHSVHTGLDLATSAGTGIRPIANGTVTFAAYNGSYGNLIKVDHGNGIESWYAHCSAIYVSVGQTVSTSNTIGAVGSTGNSTGPHLHLEIRVNGSPVNPESYLFN